MADSIFKVIPTETLTNPKAFIAQSRRGIPGSWIKDIVENSGMRDVFLSVLGVSSGNLSRIYRRPALPKQTSEEVLDTARVIYLAIQTWTSTAQAQQWMATPLAALGGTAPIALLDTFEGRRWVAQTLRKIESGEFS